MDFVTAVFDDNTVEGEESGNIEDVINENSDTTFTVDNIGVLEFAIFDDTTINGDSDLESENYDSTSISDKSINLDHITDPSLLIISGRRPIVIPGVCNLNKDMKNAVGLRNIDGEPPLYRFRGL